jgi:hypothetical protein
VIDDRREFTRVLNINPRMLDILDNVKSFRRILKQEIFKLPKANRVKDLPSYSGVYFWVNSQDKEFLYIGRSVNIRSRWYSRRDFSISKLKPVYFLLNDPPGIVPQNTAEQFLIYLFTPKYNKPSKWDLHMVNFIQGE